MQPSPVVAPATSSPPQSSNPQPSNPQPSNSQAHEEARAAVHVGLWVSATRCVLTYLVAPALGVLSVVLGPVGVLLQVAGAVTATAGARRLWALGHRARVPYAVVALAVDAITLTVLVQLLGVGA